jgi:MoaA/NifB/PqqE/SkfB family radical SAM enzyme
MRVGEPYRRSTLEDAEVRRILSAAAANRVGAVSFTGGEPMLLFDRLIDWIDYAGQVGVPYIRTGTNGFFFRNPDSPDFDARVERAARRLAAVPLRNFWISLDSCYPEVHESMRGFSGVVEGIRRALPVFHAHGLYPSANLGINRNVGGDMTRHLTPGRFSSTTAYLDAFYRTYRVAFRRFYRLVIDLGFTMVNTCYPMSVGDPEAEGGLDAVYAATAVGDIVRFTAQEKVRLFRALREVIAEFRSRLRIFSPVASLHALERQYAGEPEKSVSCRGGIDFFFIDAKDGCAYPCGYRGKERFGPYRNPMPSASDVSDCRLCDWECFRDPSELFGPLLDAASSPARLVSKICKDPAHYKLWVKDLLYYRACNFFDGRKPPDFAQLRRFSRA